MLMTSLNKASGSKFSSESSVQIRFPETWVYSVQQWKGQKPHKFPTTMEDLSSLALSLPVFLWFPLPPLSTLRFSLLDLKVFQSEVQTQSGKTQDWLLLCLVFYHSPTNKQLIHVTLDFSSHTHGLFSSYGYKAIVFSCDILLSLAVIVCCFV